MLLLVLWTIPLIAIVQEPAGEQEILNERMPYNAQHLEQMWQVDCNELVSTLLAPSSSSDGVLDNTLAKQLYLCSYIHNDPQRRFYRHCPDYRGAYKLLEAKKFTMSEDLRDALSYKLKKCTQPGK